MRPRVFKKVRFAVTVFNVLESTIPRIEHAIREAIAAETSMPQTAEEQVAVLTDIFQVGPEEDFNR